MVLRIRPLSSPVVEEDTNQQTEFMNPRTVDPLLLKLDESFGYRIKIILLN